MPNLQDLLVSLRTRPGYALMRGVARLEAVRALVSELRRVMQTDRLSELLASCEAKMGSSPFATLDRSDFVSKLDRDGIATGLTLPRDIVSEIVAHAQNNLCYADRKEQFGFKPQDRPIAEAHLGKPILVAQYFNTETLSGAIRTIANDPVLWWIAGSYLRSVPRFVGVNLWWTFPVVPLERDRDLHAHRFHRDVDDFRFFKFFFYLTSVAKGDGAHVCVAASHRKPPRNKLGDPWNLRRYSDQEIEVAFPRSNILEISGPAGTGFAENTLCIHKGLTPTDQPRLLLQLQFALFDYGVMHDRRQSVQLRAIPN